MRKNLSITVIALLVGLSMALSFLYFRERSKLNRDSAQYPLLSNRLFTEGPGDIVINFQPLRDQIKNYLTDINVPHSFYFEYINTGSSIRNGDDSQFVGASLMKVPIVMDLYKAVDEKKISIDQKVTVPSTIVNGNDAKYGNLAHLKPGDMISLRDAAKISLRESDNTAAYTIFTATQNLLPAADQSLNNLDIQTKTGGSSKGSLVYISARSYTSILKCLYFSCFLPYNDSQAILDDLATSLDNSRIRAGVPNQIQVARKVGSFSTITQSDCGIIYVPNRPYALCVMLDEGSTAADKHIKQISAMVYRYVNSIK